MATLGCPKFSDSYACGDAPTFVRLTDCTTQFEVLVRVLHIADDDTFKPSIEFDQERFDYTNMNKVADSFWNRIRAALS